MTLTTRLWLSGVLLPALVVSAILFGTDRMFHWELERALDRALLAQAAIESVSLFDGPTQAPHLHMATSPLVDSVLPFAPEGVLFGPDGAEVMRFPPREDHAHPSERILPSPEHHTPTLSTREQAGQRQRLLLVTVAAPRSGDLYTLRLSATLAQIDAATDAFHRMALIAVFVMLLTLLAVHALQSRSLRRRLSELSQHVEAIRSGDLDRALSAESEIDELSSLRKVLAEATSALRSARRTKERLLADAAHELRTPLTVMRTALDLALRRDRRPEELKAALQDTREEVARLSQLASRLLDMVATAHDDEPRSQIDLCEIARAALANATHSAEARGLAVHLDCLRPAFSLGRPQALRRAVDNLLANAIKFARGRITLQVSQDKELIRLSVLDDGPGIPDTERGAVFEPFHRSPGSPPGAGLGLAIVREVALDHGGTAYAAPVSTGACVVLALPAADSP